MSFGFFRKGRSYGLSPGEREQRRRLTRYRASLCILSGAMLGASFPPSTLGVLACFALVPLLVVLADIEETGTALRFAYLAMLVFHLITLNWTGGYAHMKDPYMMIAGAVTMTVHPLFYCIPLGAYLFVRRRLGDVAALIALPFLWTGYEYTHSLSEWSFPWLTIGNTQSFDLARIQFISATGVYGLSLWILCLNVLAFLLYSSLARRERGVPRESLVWTGSILLLFFLPWGYGTVLLSGAGVDGSRPAMDRGEVTVGIVQPDTDPWDKWTEHGSAIIDRYLLMTARLAGSASVADSSGLPRPRIVLWPETAVPYFILTDANRRLLDDIRARIAAMDIAVLTGLPHMVIYRDPAEAPPSAKRLRGTGQRYDTFNAAALLDPGSDSLPWYGKMKFVPFAERIPYADMFSAFDFLRWDVGIGGWQIGPGQVIFREAKTGARFCAAICYESAFPGFIADFVRKGAEFISIITIDSWWDNMSGAYQHERFAVLRAVENRRWVAQCAVGGISCYVDPFGRVYDATRLFTTAALSRTIGRSGELTFYSEHGDAFAQGCLWAAAAFLFAALGRAFLERIRKQQWELQ